MLNAPSALIVLTCLPITIPHFLHYKAMQWDQAATLVDQQRALVEELIRSEMSSARQVDDRVRLVRMLLSLVAEEEDTSEEDILDESSSMVSSTDDVDREETPIALPPMSDIFNAVMGPDDSFEEREAHYTLPATWASIDNLKQREYHQRTEIDLLELRVRTELYAASQRVETSRSFVEHRQLQLFDSVHHLRSSIELARTSFMHEMYEASRQAYAKRRQFATKRPHVNRLI